MDTSSSVTLSVTIPVLRPTVVPIKSSMVTSHMLDWYLLGESVAMRPGVFCLRVYLCCDNKSSQPVDWVCKTSFKGRIVNLLGKQGHNDFGPVEHEFTSASTKFFWAAIHHQREDEEKGFIVNGQMNVEMEVTPQLPTGLSLDPSSMDCSTATK